MSKLYTRINNAFQALKNDERGQDMEAPEASEHAGRQAMRISSVRRWLGLPGRLALLLGLGAISSAGADAGAITVPPHPNAARTPQRGVADFGEMRVWSEGGRLYLSEAGSDATELQLGDTAEARELRKLLENGNASAADPHILRHRLILVGGGGESGPRISSDQSAASPAPALAGRDSRPKEAPVTPKRPENTGESGPTTPAAGQKG